MASFNCLSIKQFPHHLKTDICGSRAKYRESRRGTSVKVYTVNQESTYLLVQDVPAVGAREELQSLCEQYGVVDEIRPLDEYPCEEFTETYLVKYNWFPAARVAKKYLDDKSFFGGTLHVCYAPEFETISDTRQKLQERRKFVAMKNRQAVGNVATQPIKSKLNSAKQTNDVNHFESTRGHTHNNVVNKEKNITESNSVQPVTYIWAGKEYTVYPQSVDVPSSNCENIEEKKTKSFIPRQVVQKGENALNTSAYEESFKQKSNFQQYSCPTTAQANSSDGLAGSSSYSQSVTSIRKKLLCSSVPNSRISFKRKRKI